MNFSTPIYAILSIPLVLHADWPQYLGPARSGSIADGFNAEKWPQGGLPPIKWQTRAGNGIASPIIVGDRLYTMGSLKPDANPSDGVALSEMWSEAELGTLLTPASPYYQIFVDANLSPVTYPFHPVITHAFCFNANTGALIWATPIASMEFIYKAEGMNLPRAAPLHLNGNLYFQSHSGFLTCLNGATGVKVWTKHVTDPDLGSIPTNVLGKCGIGGAPFTADGRLFYTFPGTNTASTVVALDPVTGSVLWKRTVETGFRVHLLSAAHAIIEGNPTIVVPGGYRTYGLNPADGSIRWIFDAHLVWPEISFNEAFHNPGNCVYWVDQHPGRHPVIYGDYIVNRVFIWGGHRDQRTYCIKIVNNVPQLIWDMKDLSAWRGLYIHKENLLLAMDYGHSTTTAPPTTNLCREQQVYDTERYQCIDIPTGNRLWTTNAFTLDTDSKQLSYSHFEPEHIAAGNQLLVMHMTKFGHATFDATGIQVKTIATNKSFWGFSPLVLNNGLLYFQRMAAVNNANSSFGDQQYNLFCLDLQSETPPPSNLLSQDFSAGGVPADYVDAANPGSTKMSGITAANSGQFSITNGALKFGGLARGSIVRNENFTGPPGALVVSFRFEVADNTLAKTTSLQLNAGDGFTNGTSSEASSKRHSSTGIDLTAIPGQFKVGPSHFSGSQTCNWVVNNSGLPLVYFGPDGTQRSLADDRQDFWVGTTLARSAATATTGSVPLNDFKIILDLTSATASLTIDNLNIYEP